MTPYTPLKYKFKLNEQLSDIFVPNELMLCNNVNCTVQNHDICDLYHRVIDACLKAGEYIPSTAPPKQNNISGWNDLVETHKREALT